MAINNTITFDPDTGIAYPVNVTINTGANFKSTFKVLKNNKNNFDFTGYTGSSQMTKSVSVGSSAFPKATFTVGFTSEAGGEFNISLGSTATGNLSEGRYVYDILVASNSVSTLTDVLFTSVAVGNTASIGTTSFTLNKVTNVAIGDSISVGSAISDEPVVGIATTTLSVTIGSASTSSSEILPGTAVTFTRVGSASTIYRIVTGNVLVQGGVSSAP